MQDIVYYTAKTKRRVTCVVGLNSFEYFSFSSSELGAYFGGVLLLILIIAMFVALVK